MDRSDFRSVILLLFFSTFSRESHCLDHATGSFGDKGLYKVTIEKARIPAETAGISSAESPDHDGKATTIVMHNRKGQPFRCSIPEMVKLPDERDKLVNLTTEAIEKALQPVESNRACVTLTTSGWWNYEFCFGKHVTQYHMDAGGVVTKPVITLGLFSHAFDWSNVSARDALKKKDRFHLQYFTNGSRCDITGQLRQTRVKIYCDTSNWVADHIESVREPESCGYEMIIFSRRLCAIPFFRKQDPAVSQIRCNPIGSAGTGHGKISQSSDDSTASLENPMGLSDFSSFPGKSFRLDDLKNAENIFSDRRKTGGFDEDSENLGHDGQGSSSAMTGNQEPIKNPDNAEAFYERARQFATARKEVWIPEDMIYTMLTSLLDNTHIHTPNPSNREFIVIELVKRTKNLLETKAKLNSPEERSLAFDQAAQNVADIKRVLQQGNGQVSDLFIGTYSPTIGILQMYVDQFLIMYDLDNVDATSSKRDSASSRAHMKAHVAAQISALLETPDILAFKPFSDGELAVYEALQAFGRKLSGFMDGLPKKESELLRDEVQRDVLRIRAMFNDPETKKTWRFELRERLNRIIDQQLDIVEDYFAHVINDAFGVPTVDGGVPDQSATSQEGSFIDSSPVPEPPTELPENEPSYVTEFENTAFLHSYYKAKGSLYESYGWIQNPGPDDEATPESSMSNDEADTTWSLMHAHLQAIHLSEIKNFGHLTAVEFQEAKEKYLDSAYNHLVIGEGLLRQNEADFRPALKDAMVLHAARIRHYLWKWENHAQAQPTSTNPDQPAEEAPEMTELTAERANQAAEGMAADLKDLQEEFGSPIMDDEVAVVQAVTKSVAYAHAFFDTDDPVQRKKANAQARLLLERTKSLLLDPSKNIRPEFREKYEARISKLVEEVEKITGQLDILARLKAELEHLQKGSAKLEQHILKFQHESLPGNDHQKAQQAALEDWIRLSNDRNRLPGNKRSWLSKPLPPPRSKAVQFSDVINNMDPNRRRLREVEELFRDQLAPFGGEVKLKFVHAGQNHPFLNLGDGQMNEIKLQLAGLFASQLINNNPQQRMAAELEENYNLDGDDEDGARRGSDEERIAKRVLEF